MKKKNKRFNRRYKKKKKKKIFFVTPINEFYLLINYIFYIICVIQNKIIN